MPEFDPTPLTTFMAASIALYPTPGADMMFISASGASGGSRAGIAAAPGVSIGSLFHTVLAVVGVAALIQASPTACDILRAPGRVIWSIWPLPHGGPVRLMRMAPVRVMSGGHSGAERLPVSSTRKSRFSCWRFCRNSLTPPPDRSGYRLRCRGRCSRPPAFRSTWATARWRVSSANTCAVSGA